MSRQIVLDTETTGLSAEGGDRIIEIGCVELLARKLTGNNKHFYLNPGRDSHEDALKVHGISSEFLRDKPRFEAVADELLDYLRDAEIIIHNAQFDVSFLNKELELIGRPALSVGRQNCLGLNGIAQRGAGAMALDQIHVRRAQPGTFQRRPDHPLLRGSVGGRQPVGGTVLIDRRATHHRQHPMPQPPRIGQPL